MQTVFITVDNTLYCTEINVFLAKDIDEWKILSLKNDVIVKKKR